MRRFFFVFLVLTVFIGLIAGPITGASPKNYVFRLAHITNENHPIHQGALLFKKLVETRTKGRVKIEIYPNSTLGNASQYAEQIALGAVDMGLNTSGQLQVFVREYAVVMIPFLFDSYEHAHRVLDGPAGAMLAEKAEAKGFKVLADWEWGFRAITNNKRPIKTPADLVGLKMRVPPEMQLQEMYKALGASCNVVAFNELYMALAQGVVDGQCNPIATIYDQKFYEVQKYLAITNHSYNSMMLVMSKKVWDPLPADLKKILQDAAQEVAPVVRKAIVEDEKRLIEEMKKKGMVVTYPDLKAFREKVKPALEPIAEFAGREFTESFLEYVEEAR